MPTFDDIFAYATTTALAMEGGTTTGAVELSDPAPSGLATVPPSVTVPAGASTTTFPVSTQQTATTRGVLVRATYGAQLRTAVLSVEPPPAARSEDDRPPLTMTVSMQPIAQSAAIETHFLYTPELSLLAEATVANGQSSIDYEYLWFAGQPIAQYEPATTTLHYYFNDHLGTPILTTDATGTIDWRVEREPYGRKFVTRTGPTRHQPLAFPGQEESASEASYNVFRWYRGGWGRYTQSDPALNPYSPREGPYSYVVGNPVRFKDRLGLTCGPCCSSPAQIATDKDKIIKSVHAELAKYMLKTLLKPYTTCGGWAVVVYDGITKAQPQCHSWNLVMSKEPAGFGLFDAGWPAHAAAAIKPCNGEWEKGSILDAWPSGYLKVLPWNNWQTTYGLKYTPTMDWEYSEFTEQTGSCSL